MGKKRGHVDRKTAAVPTTFVVKRIEEQPALAASFTAFLERRALAVTLALILLASIRIAATYTVFNHTFDEPVHIACGMEWLDKGVYTWEPQHPPLSRIAAAVGPYLLGIRSQNQDRGAPDSRLHEGNKILYSGHHYDLTLALSRLGELPFFWIACGVVYLWGKRYFHPAVAVLAVFAFSFEPTVLAHAGLSTTDMALTAFLGATFLTGLLWLEEPTVKRAVWFGVCGGLVIVSKFSALVFFPASAGLALAWYVATRRPTMACLLADLRRRVPTLALSGAVAFVVIWAVYRFSFGPVPFAHFKLPFPELYAGIEEVKQHNDRGHYSYLLGERGTKGWWYFFPVVFAVKTPLGYLILLGAAIYLAARRRLGFDHAWIPFAFAAGIMGVAMASSINIGLRHILPIYVVLSLVVAAAAYRILSKASRTRWPAAAVALAVGWFGLSSLLAHPDYLAYFNVLAGDHPENIVVDSDLDWGQDIKRLARRLHEVGAREVTLSTLLVADFETEHGIPHRIENLNVIHPPEGWVAIGFTYWKEMRLGLKDQYLQYTLWPDRIPPTEKVGKGMLLWYFPPGAGIQ